MTRTTTADPATATASCRPIRWLRVSVAALALASAAALAACGGSGGDDELTGPTVPTNQAAFAWVHPDRPAPGWSTKDLPSGEATLAYPRGWRLSRTDPGTVTATLRRGGQIGGYLNITPQGGDETLANWASFRPAHNREEGDEDLVGIASATGLSFRGGTGSCVQDRYASNASRHYVEIACIVRGRSATTVIVGAAPPSLWNRYSPTIEKSISSFSVE